jgi:hypothetical protein
MNRLAQPLRPVMTGFHREEHVMTRVDVAPGIPFDEFVAI